MNTVALKSPPAKRAGNANPPAASARHWRDLTAQMLAEVGGIIQAARDMDETGAWPDTAMLLIRAEDVRAGMTTGVADAFVPRDHMQGESYELMALLRGAKGLDDTPPAIRLLLDTAIALVDAATSGPGCYLDGPMQDGPCAVMQQASLDQAPTLTRETELPDGGEVAASLMRVCTYEIDALGQSVVDHADAIQATGELMNNHPAYLLRAAGLRIRQLNSLLMSYVGDDSITLGDTAWAIHHNYDELDELLAKEGA